MEQLVGLTSRFKLNEKTEIVFKQKANIANLVDQHGDAFDPHAEGETGAGLGVVADVGEDVGVDHAGA